MHVIRDGLAIVGALALGGCAALALWVAGAELIDRRNLRQAERELAEREAWAAAYPELAHALGEAQEREG